MTNTRQLAAIMFTDIQGYTALMQQNEEKAIQARHKHRKIFNSVTEKHNGKILQYFGDGTLSIFNSAIDAVKCAIEMQLAFLEEPVIPVRIGIHVGDVIISDNEIIGDGVNIASRVESLAVSGSVFISNRVHDEIKNQGSIKTSFLKSVKLKNVEKPVEVYAVSNEGLVVPNPEEIRGKTDPDLSTANNIAKQPKSKLRKVLPITLILAVLITALTIIYLKTGNVLIPDGNKDNKSIAVLPFVNMSNDPEQEYFSDGISEEILNTLVNVTGLKVAGRTSAFSFKGKNEDIRSIGEKLDVKMVLEGSVRKSGNRVRITAQLINVKDGFHLWSETYDREMEDIIDVQEEIAGQIVEKLKLQVESTQVKLNHPRNMEAYELLLKGSYFFNRDYEDKIKSMDYFKKAVELDPEYAEAYAYIGETYLHFAGLNLISTSDAYAKARTAANTAISFDEKEPRAYKVLAYINLFYDWDWDATVENYNKAVKLGLSDLNEFNTFYHIFVHKNYNKAIEIAKRMVDRDPLHIYNHWQMGICYYFAGRFEEALKSFDNALELDQSFSTGLHWRGTVLAYVGSYEEAIASIKKSLEITKGEGIANLDLLAVKILMGKKDEVLPEVEAGEYIDPMDAARLYTLMGMHEEAIDWIEKGYYARSVMMVTLKHFWLWDPLRDNPRFKEIYNKMNFKN